MPDYVLVDGKTEPVFIEPPYDGLVLAVHPKFECKGLHCVIHNQSSHHMRHLPMHWRSDRGLMERICSHGIGHPDPDEINPDDVHGCDGCCIPGPLLEEM